MPEVSPVPSEYGSIVVQLVVRDAAAAAEFYRRAFDADELFRHQWQDDPRVFHCELLIGSGRVMLQDEFPDRRLVAPTTLGGSPTTIHLYVPDVDTVYQRAVKAGGTTLSEPKDQFYGERSGGVRDVCGNHWYIATQTEIVSNEEIEERVAKLAG